jgi:hypothetical protein
MRAETQPAVDDVVDLDRAENVMAGQTFPDTDALLVPPGPVTLSVRVYSGIAAPARAGKVTGTATRAGAEAQAVVTGSPATAGVTETVHFAERLNIADRTVLPPADGESAGCTAICVIAGGASRTTTVMGLAVALPPRPVTVKPNL